MLLKLTDHKGKERWLNPIYVKSLRARGPSDTEVEISGWTVKLRVRQPADELALAINAAMPDAADFIAAHESEQAAAAARQAASSAATGGAIS